MTTSAEVSKVQRILRSCAVITLLVFLPLASACGETNSASSTTEADKIEKLFDQANDYLVEGHYEKAIETYDKVIRLDPGHTLSKNNKATAYYLLGEFDKSLEIYDEILELDPTYIQARYSKAAVYLSDDQLALVFRGEDSWLHSSRNDSAHLRYYPCVLMSGKAYRPMAVAFYCRRSNARSL